ncbi:MAG: hypothetical protein K0S27_1187 [Gammaproteobacteria bacterium]|jgi:BMFP domain-containing protein YqiC|nr:hypothetical protein [Gammaproteobacteria bacterium]
MKNKDFLNDLTQRLCETLPSHFKEIKKDVEKNFCAILQSTFNKLDLVTREEFDAQAKVLARSRKKIEALEADIKKLEKILNEK